MTANRTRVGAARVTAARLVLVRTTADEARSAVDECQRNFDHANAMLAEIAAMAAGEGEPS